VPTREAIAALAFLALGAAAQPASADPITLAYVGHPAAPKLNPLPLDEPAPHEGLAGAQLGIADDNGTGRFTGQEFALKQLVVPADASLPDALKELPPDIRFVVANLPPNELSDAAHEFPRLTFLNAGAPDDALRAEQCAANVLHTLPSRAMLTDALAQYLAFKKWRKWLLVAGPDPGDKLYADAVKRSAQKFGAQIVSEKPWTFQTANAHADTGHATLQTEIPAFTRGSDYDVVVVADEAGLFGEDLIGRTDLPRPVAGTQGLVPSAWARPFEQWGATQLQSRFLKATGRWMTDNDYGAWLAVRAVGEAATRTRSIDEPTLARYLRSDAFDLAAFKGVKLTFRPWDGQLREPLLLADARSLVSVSPQPGFLHQFSELDTLGVDRPETKCHM